MSNMYEMAKSPYKKLTSPYSSQYSSVSASLSLYRGNNNPGEEYNKVFGLKRCIC